MHKFIVPAAVLALALGSTAATAQTYQSTTEQSTPDQTTRTTTTTTTDDNGFVKYRKTVTATQRYDAGPFDAPAGYTYTRYQVGDHVPGVLLESNNLALSDYANYRLDAPPDGLKWIRVGDDAILVDRNNGEVIQTDYGLFND